MSVTVTPATAAGRPEGEEVVTGGGQRGSTAMSGHGLTPWLFLAPYLVLFLAFVVAPAIYGIWISLHDWDYTLPGKPFVGLDNYPNLFDSSSLASDRFWGSMKATAIFTVMSVPLLLVVPLAVALAMNQKFRGRNLFRAIYFAPYVLGVAVVAVVWRFLLDNNIGLVNHYLGLVGLPDDIAWTTSVPAAWFALVGVTVWWTLGFNAVIYLAGLQDIPQELYEAAALDGAGPWQQIRGITIPLLGRTTTLVAVLQVIASLKVFDQMYIMTQGGPNFATRSILQYVYDEGFTNFRVGYASAVSMLFFVVVLAVSAIWFWLVRKQEKET